MQIHELNTLNGKPVETDFLAIDTGFDTAKISAKKLLEPKIDRPIDEHNQYDNGVAGQLLRSKGNGSTEWSDVGQPTDAQTAQAISDWLDAHPEATTTVQDGSLTKDKFSPALKLEALNDFVTPEMFGAVGDGATDDSVAVQAAFDSGKPVHCENTYLIEDIVVAKGVHIIGGKFLDNGSLNHMLAFDDNGNTIDNVIIENAIFDGQNTGNGLYLNYCNSPQIRNVEVKNIKYSGGTYGIQVNRCFNAIIENCYIHNVSNDNSQPTRGVYSNRSTKTIVRDTIVHDVTSGNDGDGIQILFDGSQDETNDSCIVSNCKIYNCTKRYLKIQQKNTIIEKCTFIEEDSSFAASVATIALYDTGCLVRDNYINGNCGTQIVCIGTAQADFTVWENTRIVNNVIISVSGTVYGYLIGTVAAAICDFKNFVITGNVLIGKDLSKAGIVFRNCSGVDLVVANNAFYNLSSGVHFRLDNGYNPPTVTRCSIVGNTFHAIRYTPVNVTSGFIMQYLAVVGNSFDVIDGIGQELNVIIIKSTSYDRDKITIENNIGNGLDGWRRVGYSSLLPSYVPDGFVYFSRTITMPLTYWNGSWYKPDGTVYTP